MGVSVVVLVGAAVLIGLAVQQMREEESKKQARVPVPVRGEADEDRRR